MATKDESVGTRPDEKRVREAIRRFFAAVDRALVAAEAAQRARKHLETLTEKSAGEQGDGGLVK